MKFIFIRKGCFFAQNLPDNCQVAAILSALKSIGYYNDSITVSKLSTIYDNWIRFSGLANTDNPSPREMHINIVNFASYYAAKYINRRISVDTRAASMEKVFKASIMMSSYKNLGVILSVKPILYTGKTLSHLVTVSGFDSREKTITINDSFGDPRDGYKSRYDTKYLTGTGDEIICDLGKELRLNLSELKEIYYKRVDLKSSSNYIHTILGG